MSDQIFCPVHNAWYDLVTGVVIPPDVQASQSSCGHKLPLTAETRPLPDNTPTISETLTRTFHKGAK